MRYPPQSYALNIRVPTVGWASSQLAASTGKLASVLAVWLLSVWAAMPTAPAVTISAPAETRMRRSEARRWIHLPSGSCHRLRSQAPPKDQATIGVSAAAASGALRTDERAA